jgi:gluconate kinase
MSRLTRRAQFFIQQGLVEPQSAALSELRDKPTRTIQITAANTRNTSECPQRQNARGMIVSRRAHGNPAGGE